jgi:hypothetical protein
MEDSMSQARSISDLKQQTAETLGGAGIPSNIIDTVNQVFDQYINGMETERPKKKAAKRRGASKRMTMQKPAAAKKRRKVRRAK